MGGRRGRVFRIEAMNGATPEAEMPTAADGDRHDEVMAALADIRSAMQEQWDRVCDAEDHQAELASVAKVKAELGRIYEAIEDTKREIASLHSSTVNGKELARVTTELSAVVEGTEQATETILQSAESIDEKAAALARVLAGKDEHALAGDIQEQVVAIFEACNFQDLTGQRINKIVRAFGFIEERVHSLMDIWGGPVSFDKVDPVECAPKGRNEELLNGPALEGDEDVASQDDIDAMFA